MTIDVRVTRQKIPFPRESYAYKEHERGIQAFMLGHALNMAKSTYWISGWHLAKKEYGVKQEMSEEIKTTVPTVDLTNTATPTKKLSLTKTVKTKIDLDVIIAIQICNSYSFVFLCGNCLTIDEVHERISQVPNASIQANYTALFTKQLERAHNVLGRLDELGVEFRFKRK